MKTYIVIPNYTMTAELEGLAFNAITSFKQTCDCIVVVVDDGSQYNTDRLEKIADIFLRNEQNSGFAKTCNKGFNWVIENEQEDCYIICANNDIIVYEGWHKAITDPFSMFDNVGITGLISNREKVIDGVPIEKYQIKKITDGGLLDGWMQSGGLWCTKKSLMQQFGMFDENFKRGGWEDVDLFFRIRDIFDMKIIMSGYSMFWHKEGATRWNDEIKKGYRLENKAVENDNLRYYISKWGKVPFNHQQFRQTELYGE